jgi:hypothetical protein
MKARLATIMTTFILTVTTVYGQEYEPLDLAKRIFGKDSLPDIVQYSTGEYKGRPNGQDLQKSATTTFVLLGQTEKKAVVGMTILDSLGRGLDTYLHFKKATVWKMNAFRALARTGIIEQAKIELEKMTPQQVDDLIAKSKEKGKEGYSSITSREDYNFQLANAKLTLELDENIIKHFVANQVAFERLKTLALDELEKSSVNDERSIKLLENLKPEYRKLSISSVSTGGYELGNCINFLIGGILDDSVGYLYVKDKKDVPEMSSDNVIMIREIGNGWYVYKTT